MHILLLAHVNLLSVLKLLSAVSHQSDSDWNQSYHNTCSDLHCEAL